MVAIIIVIVIVIMVVCCTCEPTVSRANKPCLIIILPPSSLSSSVIHYFHSTSPSTISSSIVSWSSTGLVVPCQPGVPDRPLDPKCVHLQPQKLPEHCCFEKTCRWVQMIFSPLLWKQFFICLNFSLRQNLKDPLTIMVSLIKQDRLKFLAWILDFKWHLQPKWPIRGGQRRCRSLQHCFEF